MTTETESPTIEETDPHAPGPYGMKCPEHPENFLPAPVYTCPVTNEVVTASLPHVAKDDPPFPCAYHPKDLDGARCGKPTVQAMVGGGMDGMWFLFICSDCAVEATMAGANYIYAHRFGAMDHDMPIS